MLNYADWLDEVKARLADDGMNAEDIRYGIEVEEVDLMTKYYSGVNVEEAAEWLYEKYGM